MEQIRSRKNQYILHLRALAKDNDARRDSPAPQKVWLQCSKSSYRFLLVKDRDFLNALDVRQPLFNVLRDRLVALKDHDRVAALLAAVELHGGDVDVPLHECRRHGCDMAGRVLIVDDERVVLTGKVRLDTVDGADAYAPAADALGHNV